MIPGKKLERLGQKYYSVEQETGQDDFSLEMNETLRISTVKDTLPPKGLGWAACQKRWEDDPTAVLPVFKISPFSVHGISKQKREVEDKRKGKVGLIG